MKIKDEYGKKIGGSKRDLWKARGLSVTDLCDMNDAEIARDVKKANIFPIPDYAAMKAAGEDIKVIYFKKLVKDSLATKPKLPGRRAAEEYVESIGIIRDALNDIHKFESCEAFVNKILVTNGFLDQRFSPSGRAYYSSTGKGINIDISKVYKNISNISVQKVEREIIKKEFLYSDFDKFAKKFEIIQKAGYKLIEMYNHMYLKGHGVTMLMKNVTMDQFDAIPETDFIIISNYTFITHDSSKELLQEALRRLFEANQVAITSATSTGSKKPVKKRFVPAELVQCKRIVNDEIVMAHNYDPNDLLQDFGIKGCEFGNYLNDATRQESLDQCYEAFMDLAMALEISPQKVGLMGKLSLAYGARGNGDAAAHFEPARQVINLTKLLGAGTLCHEYGHAVDFILGEMILGEAFTETSMRNNLKSFNELMQVMKYKTVTNIIDRDSVLDDKRNESLRYGYRLIDNEFCRATDEQKQFIKDKIKVLFEMPRENIIKAFGSEGDDYNLRSSIIARELIAKLEELKVKYIPRSKKLKKDFVDQFTFWVVFPYFDTLLKPDSWKQERRVETDFFKGSKQFDQLYSKSSNGYWSSDTEMFARVFSCYVEDILGYNFKITNDYLCGKSDVFAFPGENGEIIRAYPYGEERNLINKAMDKFFDEVKDMLRKDVSKVS